MFLICNISLYLNTKCLKGNGKEDRYGVYGGAIKRWLLIHVIILV